MQPQSSAHSSPVAAPTLATPPQTPEASRPRLAGPDYPDPFAPEAPTSNQKSIVIAAIAVGAGLMVVGLGFAIGGRSSAQPAPVVVQPGAFEEQRQMMKEAMQMAKDAQQAQREHVEKMNKMMHEEADAPH